jgi:Kef-type K+ transport system membrane component KefB
VTSTSPIPPIGANFPDFVSPEVVYMVLLFALIVVPRVLARWQVPTAVTSLVLGGGVGVSVGWFRGDVTIQLLATLGISALFLFAGLEVDLRALLHRRRVLTQHLVLLGLTIAGLAAGLHAAAGLAWRVAILIVLALVTPSAGFILDSLASLPVSDDQRDWVRSLTIASELVSLMTLFVILQSGTAGQLLIGTAVLLALIFGLPLMFRAFAFWIEPFAPKSDFAFLLMLTLLSAFVTRKLGAYYLVGAFVVGMVAQRFRRRLPSMASEHTLHAVEVFASFFIPFYFFSAGLDFAAEHVSVGAFAIGLGGLVLVVPLRVAVIALHRRVALHEPLRDGARVAVALVPTLVFSLVIAELLREQYAAGPMLFGGLVIYAIGNTMLPTLLLRMPAPLYDQPELPELHDGAPLEVGREQARNGGGGNSGARSGVP